MTFLALDESLSPTLIGERDPLAPPIRSTVEAPDWQGGNSKQYRGKKFRLQRMGIIYIM